MSDLIKINGIIIRSNAYGDYDKMLTIISQEHGKIDCIARGCRRNKSKIAAVNSPFIYGEFILTKKSGRLSLNQCSIDEYFYDLRFDLKKLSCAARICELVSLAGHYNENIQELFKLLYYCLSYLCYSELAEKDIYITFLAKYLSLQGYSPATTKCAKCDNSTFKNARFSKRFGAICERCAKSNNGFEIFPLDLEALRRLIILKTEDIKNVVLPEDTRERLYYALREYYKFHFEREIKEL